MSWVEDRLTEQFYRWETRGRGVLTFPAPVSPEPPFVPFNGYVLPRRENADTGRRHTVISGFLDRLAKAANPPPPPLPEPKEEEPVPNWCGEEAFTELRAVLPENFTDKGAAAADFLSSVSLSRNPLVFEIVGSAEHIVCQFCATDDDVPIMERQLTAHFPEAHFLPTESALLDAWLSDDEAEHAVVELALSREFMLPLAETRTDLFVGLTGALSRLAPGECGVYQVIFAPLAEPWAAYAANAIMDDEGKPVFVNRADLLKGAAEKFSPPLYGVVVRLAARSSDLDRAWTIIREMAAPFRQLSSRNGNALMPLPNDEYPDAVHQRDLLLRQSRRSGMILNLHELIGFVHLPSAAVKSAKFVRVAESTRAAPKRKQHAGGVSLGINEHAGQSTEVWLNDEQRVRHMHIIGGTGTGKSTLLFNLIRQDLENGEGCAVLDPHGDLIDKILGVIPPERIDDVVLLDPSDERFIVPFNILSAHSDFEKMLLASDLVGVFQRLSTSWGDQMNSVFRQAVLAFLESTEGGTLADLRRFLLDPPYREKFLLTVNDADVRFYWKRGFAQLGGNKSIGPILTRLETLLSPKPLRLMLSQQENKLDFAEIMDSGKILLARLPQGQIGRENAFLLGSLLVAKMQQMAMSRQRMSAAERRPFFCYVDEFQNFITPSMSEILSSARKYRMGLILAHQELRQLEKDKEVASAVLANAYTRVVFRVSDADARALSDGFAHFEPRDMQNLEIGEAVCRIERADGDFNLRIPPPDDVDENDADVRREQVIAASRAKYATPRAEVEAMLLRKFEDEETANEKRPAKQKAAAPAPEVQQVKPSQTPVVDEVVNEPAAKPDSQVDAKAPQPLPVEPVAEPRVVTTAELGKGGYQHRIVQERIKTAAEKRGFRVTLEMPIGKGKESVDVGLLRNDIRIACEISVTTTIDHEVGNVRKCLREGFDLVAVVTAEDRRLRQIEAAVKGCFAPEKAARVQYYLPDGFISFITELPLPEPGVPSAPTPTQTVRKGWTVKRAFKLLTPEERAVKEASAFRLLSEEMRLPPPRTD